MKRNRINVPTEFAAETRFEFRPAVATPFRATQENEFERLKNRLLTYQLAAATVPGITAALRRAANEAAAIAWATAVPLLVFPALFEEKIAAAVQQAERQARVFRNSRELVVTA
ncbi:MAG TPA: hypothetical protein VFV23_03980 [Verrucomicrobiae bacterium]|nr:hypothetical protein [Verrucomicrobiae bacterium]